MNRTFFRRRRRFVLGLAFAALAVPATAQAASGLYVDGPTPGIYSHTDSQQALIDRHHQLGNLGVSTAPAITPLQADGMRLTAMAREYQRNAPASAMIDGWAYRFVNQSGGAAITPLQADGMRLTAMAREYQRNAPASAMIDGWAHRFVNQSGGATAAPAAVVSNSSTSFSWNDAGVGASIAFGVALLLTLSVAIGRRRHTRTDRTGLASA